jgi:hypothetical protein
VCVVPAVSEAVLLPRLLRFRSIIMASRMLLQPAVSLFPPVPIVPSSRSGSPVGVRPSLPTVGTSSRYVGPSSAQDLVQEVA